MIPIINENYELPDPVGKFDMRKQSRSVALKGVLLGLLLFLIGVGFGYYIAWAEAARYVLEVK